MSGSCISALNPSATKRDLASGIDELSFRRGGWYAAIKQALLAIGFHLVSAIAIVDDEAHLVLRHGLNTSVVQLPIGVRYKNVSLLASNGSINGAINYGRGCEGGDSPNNGLANPPAPGWRAGDSIPIAAPWPVVVPTGTSGPAWIIVVIVVDNNSSCPDITFVAIVIAPAAAIPVFPLVFVFDFSIIPAALIAALVALFLALLQPLFVDALAFFLVYIFILFVTLA